VLEEAPKIEMRARSAAGLETLETPAAPADANNPEPLDVDGYRRRPAVDPIVCSRCGGAHWGLCADPVGRRTRAYWVLKSLGFAAADVRRESDARLRQRSLGWVDGIVTDSGRDRALAVATCGRPRAAYFAGEYCLAAQQCRDRACVRCQRIRARELAAEVRDLLDVRKADNAHSRWFVTLTQPKPATHDPRVAIDLALRAWRRLTNTKTQLGRWYRRTFPGALRVLEVTWSPKGKLRKDGSVVPYSGWHAHFHIMLEGGSKADTRALCYRWAALVDGDPELAQDARVMDERRAGELCKYIVKPMVDVPVELGRELFRAVHGRRLMQGCGELVSWRRMVKREPEEDGVLFADLSLVELDAAYRDPALRQDETVRFLGWAGRELVEHEAPVVAVHGGIRRWAREVRAERRAALDSEACPPPMKKSSASAALLSSSLARGSPAALPA